MIKPQTLKGFRDFLPLEARKRQYVIDTLKTVFERFGFEPIETPTLEYEEILAGKYGDEGDQLMYRFEDNGKRRVAMRYDQTVPTARVVAQYANDLPIPFKRYQIQNVWRAENTQKGRYREFMQCDLDIIGISSPLADGETISSAIAGLVALGFDLKKITIKMNDRRVFSNLVENDLVTEQEISDVVIAIDKVKKIGEDGVIRELTKKRITEERAKKIISLIVKQEKTDTLKDIDIYLKNNPELQEICLFDPTLARGLNYYTGVIFEITIDGYTAGSVCGGGRYDDLIGMFAGKQIPAVGFAFGFDRIIEAMDTLQLFPKDLALATTKVLVTIFTKKLKDKSLQICSQLRENNINTEIYLGEIKDKNPLEKQFKYANQKNIPYVIVIGPEEVERNLVTLKNMQTREQQQIDIDKLINQINNT